MATGLVHTASKKNKLHVGIVERERAPSSPRDDLLSVGLMVFHRERMRGGFSEFKTSLDGSGLLVNRKAELSVCLLYRSLEYTVALPMLTEDSTVYTLYPSQHLHSTPPGTTLSTSTHCQL